MIAGSALPTSTGARIVGALSVGVLLLLPACFQGSTNTTETGLGKPTITIDAPESAEAGSIQDIVMTIENPGPGDMSSVAVAFALVGPVQEDGSLPTPVVAADSVVKTSPETSGTSQDGGVYVFGGGGGDTILPEGGELVVTFTVTMPEGTGVAANSVQVYDGNEVDRADGARLEIRVVR